MKKQSSEDMYLLTIDIIYGDVSVPCLITEHETLEEVDDALFWFLEENYDHLSIENRKTETAFTQDNLGTTWTRYVETAELHEDNEQRGSVTITLGDKQ